MASSTIRLPNGCEPAPAFSTGQIARLLNAAPRTVAGLIDDGELAGYRIGSGGAGGDRRVPLPELVAFMRRRGMPVPPGLAGGRSLFLLAAPGDRWPAEIPGDGADRFLARDAFAFGRGPAPSPGCVAVIDLAVPGAGPAAAAFAAAEARLVVIAPVGLNLYACLANGLLPDSARRSVKDCFGRPFDAAVLSARVDALVGAAP